MWRYTLSLPRVRAVADWILKTTGKVAFLLRCRGPCNAFLEPTGLETFPGEILILHRNEGSSPTLDGVPLDSGKRLHIAQPARITVGLGDIVLLMIIFQKR